MKSKFIIIFLLIFSAIISVNAQAKKIKLGAKSVVVKGKVFNEIIYSWNSGKSKSVAYQFVDRKKKALIISEVSYEFEGEKAIAAKVEIYTCPLAKINKQDSYNIEMEADSVPNNKYWRLTLITNGQGADNLFFQKQTIFGYDAKPETKAVNNVTINILDKSLADKWLKVFTR
jgi:hypothetical protein